jgi:hypothetical protein
MDERNPSVEERWEAAKDTYKRVVDKDEEELHA